MSEHPALLTVADVAAQLGLAVKTVSNRGGGTWALPRVRLGRTIRFRQSDVTIFINQRVRGPLKIAEPRKRAG